MAEPTVRFNFPPVNSRITGSFGDWYGNRQHRGVDFGSPVGTPVLAPAAGRIVSPYNDGSYGIAVCIMHGGGWHTLYAHLSYANVNIGDWVEPGYVIGYTGNTGFSTGPHLHWQLSDSYRFLVDIAHSRDPMQYIVPPEDDMTYEETLALINELKSNGDLASTTDVLACVAQIAGSEPLTYSDVERVESARIALGNLPSEEDMDDGS